MRSTMRAGAGRRSSWLTPGAVARPRLPTAGCACVPDAIWRCCWVLPMCSLPRICATTSLLPAIPRALTSWRRRPVLGRPSGPSLCVTCRLQRLSPRRATSLPPRLPPWWMRAFMAASVSRMPIAPRPRALSAWSMCCWAASDTRAVPSTRPRRSCWVTSIPHALRRRRCRAGPSWGPSAIRWSIRCAACVRPSVSRFLPAICAGSSSMPVTPVRAMAMLGPGFRFWSSLTCS